MSDHLDEAHVLLTGATGFVGQAVLEKLLSAHPTTRLSLLVRARGTQSAQTRVDRLLRKPVFSSWRESVGEKAADAAIRERITVIEGDLDAVPELPGDLDVVIHSASTVSFDLPVDEAFAANVAGPESLYRALIGAGGSPHVVHVSTAYVAGLRKGVVEERSLGHEIDRQAELEHALAARAHAETASRRPAVLRRLLERARAEHGRAGALVVAEAAESARQEWVHNELVDHGRTRARSLGWPDVYTLTKALGERVAEDMWGDRRLSVVRPTIIESALKHPYPGWIDGFKVADPLIAAYGRGLLPEFPALADTILDIIPVDYVVNVIVAAAAAPPAAGEPRYFQVSSGIRNPLPFGRMFSMVRNYFREHPLRDAEGAHVQVPAWTYPHSATVERALRRRELVVDVADRAVGRMPANDHTRRWISGLHRARRDLATLRKFTELYQPYTQTEVVFDDTNTRALHDALPADRRGADGFDVTEIDWSYYLETVHIPGVPGLMSARRERERAATRTGPLPRRRDVMAVFDLQRTVAAATPIEHYLWVELATRPPSRWPRTLGTLLARGPRYLQAELRDRGDFIRAVMRGYAGVHEDELRKVIADSVTPSLFRGIHVEARKQILAHREAGHRTILVTGEINVFVEPLAPLFDLIVAGEMEKDADGRWTGHLAASPLVGEARAVWLRRYAQDEGIELAASYAYGDSYSDRAWLEVVGHPHAVNPDSSLYRHAKSRRWPVHSWTTTPEGRLSPVLRSVRGAWRR
jgi:HAD superfamily hydrolase (TIGR01490 family)